MSAIASRIIICGLLFLFTLLSGLWVSNSRKPLNVVVFTIHKLIALVTMIIIAVNVYQLYRPMDNRAFVILVVIAVTSLLFLALIISGALLSLGKPAPKAILRVHQISPLLALAFSTMTIYLLVSGTL
jgi:hypothetical protein